MVLSNILIMHEFIYKFMNTSMFKRNLLEIFEGVVHITYHHIIRELINNRITVL